MNPPGIETGLTLKDIPAFRRAVRSWFRENGRSLPFRYEPDPYRVLVSEVMLQQTPVERVVPRYFAFVERFPAFSDLAEGSLRDVLSAWQGLGYNRRALSLHETAKEVVSGFAGALPRDPRILKGFPGIGPATAASVPVFAFNEPHAFLETNIRRVFLHFFFSCAERPVSDREILPLAEAALDRKDPRSWHYALMDLGSTLKKHVPAPNRRSLHHARQGPFKGSNREIRGLVLRLLLEIGPLQERGLLDEIGEKSGAARGRVRGIVGDLVREGLLGKKAGRLFIPG